MNISPITIQPWPLPSGDKNPGIVPPWLQYPQPITILPWPLPMRPIHINDAHLGARVNIASRKEAE